MEQASSAEDVGRASWRALTSASAGAYALAAGVTGAAFALKMSLADFFGPPYILFYPAVMLSATVGGLGPGLLSTAASAVLAACWVIPAELGARPMSTRDTVSLAAFACMGVFMSLVAAFYRRARRQVASYASERALREREARALAREEQALQQLRLFVEHAPAAVAMFDREMRYVIASRRYLSDYRLPEQDLTGRSHYEVFPEIPERWREIHRRCLAGAVEREQEDPFPRADGTLDWVRWEIRPWRDAAGEIGGLILFSEIVTERKRAEERLAAEHERLAVTLQSIGDAVIATDAAARVTLFNPVAEQLTGWRAQDAAGRPIEEVFRIVFEDSGQEAENPVQRVLREGCAVGLANHTALIARDGTQRPIADSGAPIRGADGRVTGAVLVFRDQAEERRAERALRESEARYRVIFEQAPVGVAQVEAGTGRFLQVNAALCQMLGYEREELLEATWQQLTHPDDLEQDRSAVGRMDASGETLVREKRYLRKDGSTLWASLTVSPIAWPVTYRTTRVAIVVDLSERKRAQEDLLKSEELFRQAQKLESVGRLAGGVAHDFNNLLAVILSCAESLANDVAAGVPADPEEIEEVRQAGTRGRDLTRQLLAFARKQVIAPVPLDLNEVVRGSEKLLRRLLGEDIALTVRPAPDLWRVRCDPGQLEQVILNLAVNARDAMPRGGTLALESDNARVGEEPLPLHPDARPGDYVRLVVRDTGLGMSDQVKAHLFEPFFTTKQAGQGTGLGLATVYGIVSQSGGHIHVDSAPGRGTTFELLFPRTLDAAVATAASPPAAARGTEPVLVVEDDALVREVTVRALRSGGYRVLVAEHPRQALELPRDELSRLRLLVTDVVMPGLDGRALADELCRRHPGLKVLYVSGYTRDAVAERGVLDSGMAFLAKPFTGTALLARVRAVLDAS